MFAITTLLLVLALSLLITRVGTVILTASGMSRECARFQARSAFTGAGFTTSESEHVVNHPLRRRVVAMLMLLGNVGIVATASSAILGFRGGVFGGQWWRLLELVAGLLALVFVSRSAWVDRRLTATISYVLRRYTDLPTRDHASLLELSGDYAVSELAVKPADWVTGRSLADLALRDEGIVVLALHRADGSHLPTPTGHTVVAADDALTVYGRGDLLRELDDRPAGPDGDLAHRAAVARQQRLERAQHDNAATHRDTV